jgi:hypothetical protein
VWWPMALRRRSQARAPRRTTRRNHLATGRGPPTCWRFCGRDSASYLLGHCVKNPGDVRIFAILARVWWVRAFSPFDALSRRARLYGEFTTLGAWLRNEPARHVPQRVGDCI